ncbi:MAG: type II toxin-antitoxin system VapB family antitoxin [Acidiferrobacteraceae bacterium]
MRTNIVIRDKLMSQALKVTGYKTKREVVEAGLEMLVKMARQQEIRAARGKLHWEGDLETARRDA